MAPASQRSAPLIFVVSGPGGVGKGTVVGRVVARDDHLWLSQSWTTRDPRPGERADAYRFSTREEFERHIEKDGFLEWAEFQGNLYGTPRPDVPDGDDVMLEIDVQGARQVQAIHPEAHLIFIDTPSVAVQAERLRHRGDPEDKVQDRLRAAERERAAGHELGARWVINDELDVAVDDLEAIIAEARAARSGSGD